jgi:heterodisulfide reductase subunit A-like polyferredoxin
MLKLKINMDKKVVIVGAGVAGVNAATKLVDNGYPGELITIIDMGKSPYEQIT